jgi:hypothetical protein
MLCATLPATKILASVFVIMGLTIHGVLMMARMQAMKSHRLRMQSMLHNQSLTEDAGGLTCSGKAVV